MNPSISVDETAPKGRQAKCQDGPLLMSPRGSLSRPLTYQELDSEGKTGRSESKDDSDYMDTGSDDEAPRVLSRDIITQRRHLSSISDSKSTLRDLFGGAITMNIPESYKDVSDLRQVPDHQEVYLDQRSTASFIVEILSYEDSVPDDNAAAYFFDDLAQANQATSSAILSSSLISDPNFIPSLKSIPNVTKCCLIGRQNIPIRHAERNQEEVILLLVAIRLPNVGSDILITVNCLSSDIPSLTRLRAVDFKFPSSVTTAETLAKGVESIDLETPRQAVTRQNSSSESAPAEDVPAPVTAIRWALHSLRIVDWSLFA